MAEKTSNTFKYKEFEAFYTKNKETESGETHPGFAVFLYNTRRIVMDDTP
ncbi:hypothetical protein [Endozoicomonas ascidiicola]|nr:hypothetical protein [Endozoicomonas ascidiicola]